MSTPNEGPDDCFKSGIDCVEELDLKIASLRQTLEDKEQENKRLREALKEARSALDEYIHGDIENPSHLNNALEACDNALNLSISSHQQGHP